MLIIRLKKYNKTILLKILLLQHIYNLSKHYFKLNFKLHLLKLNLYLTNLC